MNQRRPFRFLAALSVSISVFLTACGGGGGDSGGASALPPTQTTPPPVVSAPPTTSGSSLTAPDARARIMAATAAVNSPALGTTEALPVTAGARVIMNEIQHFIGLNKTDAGKYFGLSNEAGTRLIDPTMVKKTCYNSFETGWNVGGRTSRACAPVDAATGYAELPQNATCNRSLGTWSVVLKGPLKAGKDGSHWDDWEDGDILWADHESERKWVVEGLPVVYHAAVGDPLRGLIEYGAGGRRQPTISSVVVGGKLDVTIDFGSNCLGGFGYEDSTGQGQLTDLMPTTDTYFKFLYQSDEEGWGIVQVGDRQPSRKEAYPMYDTVTGSYKATFSGVKCATRGQITVYRGVGPADSVTWAPGVDHRGEIGYGAGWFAIQRDPTGLQLWEAVAPVVFDRTLYQFVLTAC